MRQNLEEVWEASGREAEDPGLKQRYVQLPRLPVRLVVCPQGKAVNQGGIVRIAEAYRVEHVDFMQEDENAVELSGSIGAWTWQSYSLGESDEALNRAISEGFTPVALNLSDRAVAVEQFEWTFPTVLVVGSEKSGVPGPMLERCRAEIAIPMYGLVTSINVASATAICLQYAVQAYRRLDPNFVPARGRSQSLVNQRQGELALGRPKHEARGDAPDAG